MGVGKPSGQSIVGEGTGTVQGTKGGGAYHSLGVDGERPCRLGIAAVPGPYGSTTTGGRLPGRRGG